MTCPPPSPEVAATATAGLLTVLVDRLRGVSSPSDKATVARAAMAAVAPRETGAGGRLAAPIARLLELWADALVEKEEFREAAVLLGKIDLDGAGPPPPDPDAPDGGPVPTDPVAWRLHILVQIGRLYLESGDHLSAEETLRKGSVQALVRAVEDRHAAQRAALCAGSAADDHASIACACHAGERAQLILYWSARAMCLDRRRKYLDAADGYLRLSRTPETDLVSEEEKDKSFRMACACVVLARADAGGRRARLLADLAADSRVAAQGALGVLVMRMGDPGGGLLLAPTPEEIAMLEEGLNDHQRTEDEPGGRSALVRSVQAHNLDMVARTFDRVSSRDLASMMGCGATERDAEEAAAKWLGPADGEGARVDGVVREVVFRRYEPQSGGQLVASLCAGVEALADHLEARG